MLIIIFLDYGPFCVCWIDFGVLICFWSSSTGGFSGKEDLGGCTYEVTAV